jgi:hypothetical protein
MRDVLHLASIAQHLPALAGDGLGHRRAGWSVIVDDDYLPS